MVKETTFVFVAPAGFFVSAIVAAASRFVAATVRGRIAVVIIGITVLAGVAMAVIMLAGRRALLVAPVTLVVAAVAVIAVVIVGSAVPGIADAVAPTFYLVSGAVGPVFQAISGAVHPGIITVAVSAI